MIDPLNINCSSMSANQASTLFLGPCSTRMFLLYIYFQPDNMLAYSSLRSPNILIGHLFLNLRCFYYYTEGSVSTGTVGEPVFAQNRFLGNIGAPVDSAGVLDQIDEEYATPDEAMEAAPAGSQQV